ncbi:MAG TPA: PH domain-containing protein [Nitrososphaera sp.]|nr:PH domain-containing protein [Nitrososphaera sp.]
MVSAIVGIEGNNVLVIEPRGRLSKFLTLAKRVKVPLACIKDVSTKRAEIRGIRIAGTALPPHYAGRFYDFRTGKKIFYALSDRYKCVTFSLEGAEYDEIVVQVNDDDKERVAEMVKKELAGRK